MGLLKSIAEKISGKKKHVEVERRNCISDWYSPSIGGVDEDPFVEKKTKRKSGARREMLWKTKDGRIIRVMDMGDQHILNCIRHIESELGKDVLVEGDRLADARRDWSLIRMQTQMKEEACDRGLMEMSKDDVIRQHSRISRIKDTMDREAFAVSLREDWDDMHELDFGDFGDQ